MNILWELLFLLPQRPFWWDLKGYSPFLHLYLWSTENSHICLIEFKQLSLACSAPQAASQLASPLPRIPQAESVPALIAGHTHALSLSEPQASTTTLLPWGRRLVSARPSAKKSSLFPVSTPTTVTSSVQQSPHLLFSWNFLQVCLSSHSGITYLFYLGDSLEISN